MNTNIISTNITLEQDSDESDKPPDPRPRPARSWRVAVIANIKGESSLPTNAPEDAGAEFDRKETVQAIRDTIESDGHTTFFLSADATLPYTLRDVCPDICFNIAEGLDGDAREAQVPALLEMLHIPYTGSRVFANTISLDKTATKRVWRDHGLPTAPFQEFVNGNEAIDDRMRFPMFVKPAREGTGMGMDGSSIVNNKMELYRKIKWVIRNYHQPALVEEYLTGREFTVVIFGRRDAARYSLSPRKIGNNGYRHLPVQEIDTRHSITPGVYGRHAKSKNFGEPGIPDFICPAPIDADLEARLQDIAVRAHEAIQALDFSRIDIRLDREGKPMLMEINTLPGLIPDFSDLCVTTNAAGMSYHDLILNILYLGASRYGLLETQKIRVPQSVFLEPARVVRSRAWAS